MVSRRAGIDLPSTDRRCDELRETGIGAGVLRLDAASAADHNAVGGREVGVTRVQIFRGDDDVRRIHKEAARPAFRGRRIEYAPQQIDAIRRADFDDAAVSARACGRDQSGAGGYGGIAVRIEANVSARGIFTDPFRADHRRTCNGNVTAGCDIDPAAAEAAGAVGDSAPPMLASLPATISMTPLWATICVPAACRCVDRAVEHSHLNGGGGPGGNGTARGNVPTTQRNGVERIDLPSIEMTPLGESGALPLSSLTSARRSRRRHR